MSELFQCTLCDYKGSQGWMHLRNVHGYQIGQAVVDQQKEDDLKKETEAVVTTLMPVAASRAKITITRKMEFDAGHRVYKHEGKCNNIHGHRYVVELECEGELDSVGRVIDFSVIKSLVGEWIDQHLDHGMILSKADPLVMVWGFVEMTSQKLYVMEDNPTAENIAMLLHHVASDLLKPLDIYVTSVTVHETPNCKAVYRV